MGGALLALGGPCPSNVPHCTPGRRLGTCASIHRDALGAGNSARASQNRVTDCLKHAINSSLIKAYLNQLNNSS
jgi:hypothetical protein